MHSRKARPKGKSRFTVAYWKERVAKVEGRSGQSPTFSIQIAYQGRRSRFPLRTAEKEAAAEKALAIFRVIEGEGWDAAMDRFKPSPKKRAGTVGELIAASRDLSTVREATFNAYAGAFRRIAADIAGVANVTKETERRDRERTMEVRDAVRLDSFTPAALLAWRNGYLRSKTTDPQTKASAAVSVNAIIRNAQSLFPKKLRGFLSERVELPEGFLEAFDGIPKEKEPSARYLSKIDPEEILANAEGLIAGVGGESEEPLSAIRRRETYKGLLLCLVFGLRKSEADVLLWEQFDLESGTLRIEDTEFKQLKSADSAGEIAIPSKLVPILQGFLAGASGDFVLESANATQRKPGSYRCQSTWKALTAWLRKQGVDSPKPIHSLRKEIGSVIASKQGIFAASRYLRHADIGTTAKYYADQKAPVVAPLAMFADDGAGEIEEGEFRKERKA